MLAYVKAPDSYQYKINKNNFGLVYKFWQSL